MAKILTEEEIKKLQEETKKQDEKKLESQEKQGKTFVNYGQGNIPEEIWKNLPGKVE